MVPEIWNHRFHFGALAPAEIGGGAKASSSQEIAGARSPERAAIIKSEGPDHMFEDEPRTWVPLRTQIWTLMVLELTGQSRHFTQIRLSINSCLKKMLDGCPSPQTSRSHLSQFAAPSSKSCTSPSGMLTCCPNKCLTRLGQLVPSTFLWNTLLKACSSELNLRQGKSMHVFALKCGVDGDVFVGTSLVDLYGKCKEIRCARKVFDEMSDRNVVTWTAMVVGYLNVEDLVQGKMLFDLMPERNVASWNALICGLVKIGDLKGARKLFDEMPDKNVVSYTTMIDGYAKSGDMASARFLFDEAPHKDIVAWSALISGYAQNGQPNEAVKIFIEMTSRNVKPDEFTLVSLMSACSQVGSLELAKRVNSLLSRIEIDARQPHVIAALIDMNAKCGNMDRAEKLFEELPNRDLISYSSMIQGFSMHGHGKMAVNLFNRMISEGLIPDEVAFTVILTACSHAGLVEEGWHYFESMRNVYSIVPSPDHYSCMVDLLSRTGQLKTAYELLISMPGEPHAGAWGALLGACKLHCDLELAEVVGNRILELEPQNAGNYVLLSNIYAAAGRWFDVSLVRNKMKERGVRKIPGRSWI
ncbi:hypothetical protein JRO89_XS12G0117000 [Xanthoceras sorbifolium]|uniref:Pentatricopeptide repeat-containing protein n=1 Tax=Xanthoceras sorbifolium TaxID=99658 RepID=A0ABQ8HCB4_9ROSI|nr:hypothetical protein JRO89_XS12G0117000 [Xanthoceras sorbifolium]